MYITAPADITNVESCSFANNLNAIEITTSGTYNFNGLQFSGNTWQVDFSGTGTATINPSNGSNVAQGNVTASGGGTITVNTPSVNLTFAGLKSGSEVRIIRVSDRVELDGIESSGTSWTFSHTLAGTIVDIHIINLGYQWYSIVDYELIGANATIPIQQVQDRNYSNP
jgi:hypothetical protein